MASNVVFGGMMARTMEDFPAFWFNVLTMFNWIQSLFKNETKYME
jgi:hypothetical protein